MNVESVLREVAGTDPATCDFSAVQEAGHPHREHVYLWFLAVDPGHQRGGVGRALLARVYEEARA